MAQQTLLPKIWEVPTIFRDRLGKGAGRQRSMFSEGHLLVILHAPPKPGDDERTGCFYWRSPDGKWKSTAHGSGIGALQKHLEEYQKRIAALEKMEARAQSAKEYFTVLNELTPLNRATRNLYAALQQAREMATADRELITCRDWAGDLDRDTDLLFTDTKNGLDILIAQKAEEQAQQSLEMSLAGHRLNVLVAIFFPLATLAALLGMNVPHGLEQAEVKPPMTFLIVLLIGLATGVVLKLVYMDGPKSSRTSDAESNSDLNHVP